MSNDHKTTGMTEEQYLAAMKNHYVAENRDGHNKPASWPKVLTVTDDDGAKRPVYTSVE